MSAAKKNKTTQYNWRSFKEARAFVHSLGLKNQAQWNIWAKSKERPQNIPSLPSRYYHDFGWVSWGDWLGNGRIANQNMVYRSFEEARTVVHNLRLKNQSAWRTWSKTSARPDDIPANPPGVYKGKGWISWGDWLNTKNRKGEFLLFQEARSFAHTLKLKNLKEWKVWIKTEERPLNIPANPAGVYKNQGWKGWGDWLGTHYIANQNRVHRPFVEARAFVHDFGLQNKDEWSIWAKSDQRPTDIPANPPRVYKGNGWISWGDWLGTDRIASQNMVYRSFEEARAFVLSLGLKSTDEWIIWAKSAARPDDIPADPRSAYKDIGWTSTGDWLGTRHRRGGYRLFKDAREFRVVTL